jgi:alcohol dehydrogenase class IV
LTLFGAVRTPNNIVFGAGQRNSLPEFASRAGQRALIITDERLAADRAFRDLVDSVGKTGIQVRIFAGVIAELPVDCIAAGVEVGKAFGADFVIGIGGGSCLDAAKVISLRTGERLLRRVQGTRPNPAADFHADDVRHRLGSHAGGSSDRSGSGVENRHRKPVSYF